MTMTNMGERFAKDIANHQMTVLQDDGLYRHLRFQSERSGAYWFDLITVPGTLIFQGDGESYVFRRTEDMFEFFRRSASTCGGQPNISYWAEKLTSRSDVKKYDQELLELAVNNTVNEFYAGDTIPAGLEDAVRRDVLDVLTGDESLDRDTVDSFEFYKKDRDPDKKGPDFRFEDALEWYLKDYYWWYVWACHAIVWGIAQYDQEKARTRTTEQATA